VTPPHRLVIVAPNWLGDAVMALPLVADLRRNWPETEISVAARRSVAPLFAMVPGVGQTLTLEGAGGLRALGAAKRNAALLAERAFDAALLLPNSFHSAWVVSRAKIKERWGFPRDLRGRLLTRAIARPGRDVHQAEYYQALGAGLGLPVGDRFARIDVTADHKTSAQQLVAQNGVAGRRFVVFAPGAAYGRAKQWRPERFAELAGLVTSAGLATVLVGTRSEAAVCREIARMAGRMPRPATVTDCSGRTDLPTLAGLMSLAEAVVSNDSGAMHLAAAAGARVVAVFGPTDDRKTSPLQAGPGQPAPIIVKADVWCRPCMLRECPIDHRCMKQVSARAVFDALAIT
jgi:heptosyltransferase-2